MAADEAQTTETRAAGGNREAQALTNLLAATLAVAGAALLLSVGTFFRGESTRDRVSPCVPAPNSQACQDSRKNLARSGDATVACIYFERATGREPRYCQNVDTGVSIDDPGKPGYHADPRNAGPHEGGDAPSTPPASSQPSPSPDGHPDGNDPGDQPDPPEKPPGLLDPVTHQLPVKCHVTAAGTRICT